MSYFHGGDIYRNSVEYDFSVNINPLGMPKESIKAAQNGILLSEHYPDYKGEKLCNAIADKDGVRTEQIVLGNGAAELIYALCYAVRPKKGLLAVPCFQEYEEAVKRSGGIVDFYNLREDDNFRLGEDFIERITDDIDIIFICNPNNPTGNITDKELLEKIAVKCESTNTYFCIDECFLPFLLNENEITFKNRIDEFPHLIVLRAFTKIYAMAGLRLGYALSSNEKLLKNMRSTMQPWNTSIPAQMAGIEALKDSEYIEKTLRLISEEKKYLINELSNGLADKIYASAANYIFFKAEKNLKELLLKQKILIRSCGNYRNLTDDFYRIGVRTHSENQELIKRWKDGRFKIWQSL